MGEIYIYYIKRKQKSCGTTNITMQIRLYIYKHTTIKVIDKDRNYIS